MSSSIRPLVLTALSAMLFATAHAGERVLDIATAQKQEVRHSMIGVRNTLIFYTFATERAVLRLAVDNKDVSMPVHGTVYLFADDVSTEALGKWLNNQHSDALYPETPEPILTHELPDGTCKVTEKTAGAERVNEFDQSRFLDYKIKIAIDNVTLAGKFKLNAFTADSGVFVKQKQLEIKRRGAARVGPTPSPIEDKNDR